MISLRIMLKFELCILHDCIIFDGKSNNMTKVINIIGEKH